MKPQGCRDCRYSVWKGGDRVCQYRPHDFRTPQQRAIVDWLRANPEAFSDPLWTCPSFQHHDPTYEVRVENERLREALRVIAERECPTPHDQCPACMARETLHESP